MVFYERKDPNILYFVTKNSIVAIYALFESRMALVESSIKALQKPFKKRVNRDDIKFRDKIEYVGGNMRSVKTLRDYFAVAENHPCHIVALL